MMCEYWPYAAEGCAEMRVCGTCKRETSEVFCPGCHSLTFPKVERVPSTTSSPGDSFECTIWQGPNRSRGIEVPVEARNKHFSKEHDVIVLHIEGQRTVSKLTGSFWKRPAVIRASEGEDGRDRLLKFFEKHHLLPPDQSLKEKGIVDTLVFEVLVPRDEFKVTIAERLEKKGEEKTDVEVED